MINGIVAIVGSPNVGKSTIFNRIIGDRKAIVDDIPGLTRDRLYAKGSWLQRQFYIIDTGGIQIENVGYQSLIRAQVEIAIEEADVILFVVDGRIGISKDDLYVAKMLYKAKKPIVLAVNKIDDIQFVDNINEFYQLGLGQPIAVSSSHGIGIGDMLDEIIKKMPEQSKQSIDESVIHFSVIGRPNVGKSSLVNGLLKQERVIVSDVEGTTRDAVDISFTHEDRPYTIIDTAGLKKRGKIFEAIDKYAALRALKAIDRSDICLLVIDGSEGIMEQDKHIAGYAHEADKAIIIVVNKWDLVKKDQSAQLEFSKLIRDQFKFMDYAPIVFVSAKNRSRLPLIFNSLNEVYQSYQTRVATSLLNQVFQDAQVMNPSPEFNGGRLKIYYVNQVDIKPPTFVMFTNHPSYMHFSYLRYLENRLRNTFNFEGTPIKLIARERK